MHMHTTHSDGAATPEQLLELVKQKNISTFAVTDHDTVSAYAELKPILGKSDPELLSGVELSTSTGGRDIHLLAYLFDVQNDHLLSELHNFQTARIDRGKKIVEKLNKLGVPIVYEEVTAIAGKGVIGRPHIAEALVRRKAVKSYDEAFFRYIGSQAEAFVPKKLFHPVNAIKMVHEAGGIVSMAHPGLEEAYSFLDELVAAGLDGIEVFHPTLSAGDSQKYQHLAKRHNLIMTGGSDYHGRNDHHGPVGSQPVPESFIPAMKERAQKIRGKA